MLDRSKLSDAYGPATDIPRLLAALEPDPAAGVWDELISRICHQGSTYSASYPALPHLLDAARRWPAPARVTPLCLAADIVASDDTDAATRAGYADTHAALRQLTADTLDAQAIPQSDLVWLQRAFLLLCDERTWAPGWDRLLDGEVSGACPGCGVDLYLVIGGEGCFATAADCINGCDTPRVAIVPAARAALVWPGDWLFDIAHRHGDGALEHRIVHAFGTSACPDCGTPFRLGDALQDG